MRCWRLAALLMTLAACQERAATPVASANGAGAALERAAISAGVVDDPATLDPTGTFGTDAEAVCLLPLGNGTYRIGASLDYGEGQHCIARGTARGRSDVAVAFDGDCRFTASFEGERLMFPATVPAACQKACSGRASLAALRGDRIGSTAAEASQVRGVDGKILCPG